jgi:hypothetical protein
VKFNSRICVVILLACATANAGSPKFVSTWRNPDGGSLADARKKVATFVLSPDASMREGPEETLATELRSLGTDTYAGYTVLPAELAKDTEKAKEFIKKAGITGAVLVRLVGDEMQTSYTPGAMWYTAAHYPTFWSYWNYGWSSVYSTGYVTTDRVVSVEVLLYSVERDTLIWAGRSETANPKDIRKFVKDLVKAAAKKLRKDGLIAD